MGYAVRKDGLGWRIVAASTDCGADETYSNEQPVPYEATAEGKAALIRATRDAKLTACDWTQLADAPLSAEVKAAWSTYRQALRDITAQAGFPQDVTWPSEPGA
ncbi:tail fiber assembly protein [Humidesulfovibrio idahonensis]